MTDKIIDKALSAVFSVPSLLLHVLVFGCQLLFHIDQNAITNYISWEAIFIGILIGIQQLRHRDDLKEHITKNLREVKR